MLPNIFWSRTDYISGAYATKMVAISSPVSHPPRKNRDTNWIVGQKSWYEPNRGFGVSLQP